MSSGYSLIIMELTNFIFRVSMFIINNSKLYFPNPPEHGKIFIAIIENFINSLIYYVACLTCICRSEYLSLNWWPLIAG